MEARLTSVEVQQITGYRQPGKQLAELLAMGFWRARRSRLTGAVILERAHYEAVCRGIDSKPVERPRLHKPSVRPA